MMIMLDRQTKNTLCFVVPFFGKLPNTFECFLLTVKRNPSFDWLLITDDKTEYDYPTNIHVVYSSFEELKALIQQKFDFEITLDYPRKLCDYKPAYGFIFSEYLINYEYWGYCDVDQYFGDLKKWLTNDYLSKYDKVFSLGHMTIYRNCADINRLFMREDKRNNLKYNSYKQVFQCNNELLVFDELPNDSVNINALSVQANIRQSFDRFASDILPFRSYFSESICGAKNGTWSESEKGKNYIVLWNNGRIFLLAKNKGEIEQKEVLYVHIQKRELNNKKFSDTKPIFIVVPNKIISFDKLLTDRQLRCYFLNQRTRKLIKVDEIKKACFELKLAVKFQIRKRFKRTTR